MYRSSLSLRGQVTIPKPLREKLGLKPGDELIVTEASGRIVLTPRLVDPVGQGRGFLARLICKSEGGPGRAQERNAPDDLPQSGPGSGRTGESE